MLKFSNFLEKLSRKNSFSICQTLSNTNLDSHHSCTQTLITRNILSKDLCKKYNILPLKSWRESSSSGDRSSYEASVSYANVSRPVHLVCGSCLLEKAIVGTPTAEEVEVKTRLRLVAGRGLVRDWVEVVWIPL